MSVLNEKLPTHEKATADAAAELIVNNSGMFWVGDVADACKGIYNMQVLCHGLADKSGWWKEYDEMPEKYRKHFLAGKNALITSEISEALEGLRKDTTDTHLPHRKNEEVELADAMIRILDYAGKRNFDIAGAVIEKLAYNQRRPDHKIENRETPGGKSL